MTRTAFLDMARVAFEYVAAELNDREAAERRAIESEDPKP
jgi:hypothetical protein